jgi:hypothetical protein
MASVKLDEAQSATDNESGNERNNQHKRVRAD